MTAQRRTIVLIAGARPNFMKLAPVHACLRAEPRVRCLLVHTGQHYDDKLSAAIFRDLDLPDPDVQLGAGSASASEQTARILSGLDPLLAREAPAAVLVFGDVTSTLAGALAASNQRIPIAHVEAGLRSFDWRMPEERNRVLVDRLSRWLFVSEPSGVENLQREGIRDGVHLVGNVMIDSLLRVIDAARAREIDSLVGLQAPYAVLTLHRPGNVDDAARLVDVARVIRTVSEFFPIVFPVHPRTRPALGELRLPERCHVVDPLGYLDFLGVVSRSALVLTDSGGIQEETTVLGIPCLTLRPNTERPITVEVGTNEIVDLDCERIRSHARAVREGRHRKGRIPELWDGRAAERVVAILQRDLLR
jgi:UDP-N-acetylglucosamine 2-epimerase (non-hydrolysing)